MSDHTTLAEALVAAQADMPAVDRDGTNPHFRSRFTTLGHLLAKIRPVLNKHGIVLVQMPSMDGEGRSTLTTRLIHSSGDALESTMPLILAKADAQGQGSSLTYARRYALAAMLGISDQEDDDGNAAVKVGEEDDKVRMERAAELERRDALGKRIKDAGIGFDRLCTLMTAAGADAPENKTAKAVRSALGALTPEQTNQIGVEVEG